MNSYHFTFVTIINHESPKLSEIIPNIFFNQWDVDQQEELQEQVKKELKLAKCSYKDSQGICSVPGICSVWKGVKSLMGMQCSDRGLICWLMDFFLTELSQWVKVNGILTRSCFTMLPQGCILTIFSYTLNTSKPKYYDSLLSLGFLLTPPPHEPDHEPIVCKSYCSECVKEKKD